MSTSREGPNPLRPYYIPPSIGIPQNTPGATSSGTPGVGLKNGSASSYASSARDMFSDIDYSDYLSDSSPSSMQSFKRMLDDAAKEYFSILISQPFYVAKTVLQVKSQVITDGSISLQDVEDMRRPPSSYRDSLYSDYPSDESDPDEPAYFTSSAQYSQSYSPPRSRRRRDSDRDGYASPRAGPTPTSQLGLKRSDSVLEVIQQEWSTEGAWGVWKATNATFVYSVLQNAIESWSRSLLSALLNVPDPSVTVGLGTHIDVIDSPYPWASLGVAIAAAAAAGIILAPLDLVRTKLILFPTSSPKRSLLQTLRSLPSYICPSTIIIPTVLHSVITPAFKHSTPLILRSRLGIDPIITPTTYSFATFLSQTVDLFLRLPIETVLRRGQMAVLASPPYHLKGSRELETVVDIGPYRGTVGTMWSIIREEGTSSSQVSVNGPGGARAVRKGKTAERKGQGLQGLWRGWRVGMWGIVGVWGSNAINGLGSSGGEF